MTKRAKRFVFVSCVFLSATATVICFWPKREPSYGGKNLSEWVSLVAPLNRDTNAEAAITHIGPVGLPYFSRWIQFRQPETKGKIRSGINDILNDIRLKFYPVYRKIFLIDPNTRAVGAERAFSLIAAQTPNALPELGKIANNSAAAGTQTYETSERACYALRHFGAPGVPYLLQLLTNHQHVIAADVLGCMGADAFPAIPALIQSLHSAKRGLPVTAARALGRLQQEPDLVVPALTAYLTNTTTSPARAIAITALENFGTNAVFAASSVRPLLADPDASVRNAATNFFAAIDQDTVAKATVP
jgi:hypothetical protein